MVHEGRPFVDFYNFLKTKHKKVAKTFGGMKKKQYLCTRF